MLQDESSGTIAPVMFLDVVEPWVSDLQSMVARWLGDRIRRNWILL
ncbi:MAG: hypothetical protein NW224_07715 [Leptolyngbyaceae cyanobacterium bins.302]|nr:hypothetical protein [Leptolyngbyaceae cyanobacterium bins.302]